MLKRVTLEALHQLSLILGNTLDLAHECSVLIKWLNDFIQPKIAAFFLVDEGRQNLILMESLYLKPKERMLSLGYDPWEWLKKQGVKLPRILGARHTALPIIHEGELLGLLLYISRRRGRAGEEEQKVVNLAIGYFGPIARNIFRYLQVEALVEKRTAELRISEERHRYISELISDYAYVFLVSPEGKLKGEWLSESFVRTFGFTQEEIDARGGWQSLVHPADLPTAILHAQKVLFGQPDVCEKRFITKQGEIRWLRDYARPVFDENLGRVVRIYGAAQDITDKKKREEALERQLKELTTLQTFGNVCATASDEESLIAEFMKLFGQTFYREDFGLYLMDEAANGLRLHRYYRQSSGLAIDFIPLGEGVIGQVAEEGKPKRVADVSQEKNYIAANPKTLSELAVPIKIGDKVIAVINTESASPNYFTEDDERLLATVAFQLGTALEKIRLEREIRQRLAELEAINKISTTLRQAEKTSEALSILLTEILAVLDLEAGAIYFYYSETEELRLVAGRGWLGALEEEVIKPGEGIVGHVFSTGQAYFTHNVSEDPLVLKPRKGLIPENWQAFCLPIKVAEKNMGLIFVSAPASRPLKKEQTKLLFSLAEIAGIALHRIRLFEETQRRLRHLSALRTIDLAISATTELRVILDILSEQVKTHLEAEAAAVFLFNPVLNQLEYAAGSGLRTYLRDSLRFHLGEGFLGQAALERRLFSLTEAELKQEPTIFRRFWKEEGFSQGYAVPLVAKGEIKGVLAVFQSGRSFPQKEWLEFLEALAAQTAVAIADSQLYEELQRANIELTVAYDATIEGWVKTLDLRDKETEGHTQRVTKMTLQIARAMGIREEQLVHIRRGAILHDIGKIAVPDHILFKPGPLDESEWDVMRQHPRTAYEMLYPIKFLRPALDIPYCHHERWDGSGYPRGLKKGEIPLAARIFAVADVYDALTSDRPYRRAWSEQEAIAFIKQQSGRLFDPEVVAVFLESLKQKG